MPTFDPGAAQDHFESLLRSNAPIEHVWAPATPLFRVHRNRYGPAEFHSGGTARFSPFHAAVGTSRRPPASSRKRTATPVGTLYASDTEVGALSETVLRELPITGRKSMPRSALIQRKLSTLDVTRPLRLADFTGHGLRHIGLKRREIIEADHRAYSRTQLLGQAVHDLLPKFDGIIWVSRQHDLSRGLVLFEDRVAASDLDTSETKPTYPLAFGHGRELVDSIANTLGITLVDP